jgi:hypothetical protein
MTTTRLIKIAVALAILSTACTVAAFVLMFPIRRRADDRGILRASSQRSGSGGGGR